MAKNEKGYFTAKDLREFLQDIEDDTEIYIANSFNPVGNISELAEARKDTYGFFGKDIPCVILDSAMNVELDD